MKNDVINVYLKKSKVLLFLIVSLIFTIISVSLFDKIIENKSAFEKIILLSGMILFGFGVVLSIIYLLRKKPMLTIDDEKITIYKLFGNPNIVYLENIKSVNIWTTYHKSFVSNRQIVFELRNPTDKYKRTLFYKLIKEISSQKTANTQYGIQTNFLDLKYSEIEKIINEKIKNVT